MEECFTLATAKNKPKAEIEKITQKLSSLLKGRLLECLRVDRRTYIKSEDELNKFICEITNDEEMQRNLRDSLRKEGWATYYQVKDRLKELQEPTEKKEAQ